MLCCLSFLLKDLIIDKRKRKKRIKFGKAEQAEVKLLGVIIYFTTITVLSFALDSYTTAVTPNLYLNALLPYFSCESAGQESNRDCQRFLEDVQQPNLVNLTVAQLLLVGCSPIVVFLFSADFKLIILTAKKLCGKLRRTNTLAS